jgi:hypothetical protein
VGASKIIGSRGDEPSDHLHSCRAPILAFREVAHLIPEHIPLILETPIPEPQIDAEIDRALSALPLCREESLAR